MFFFDFFAFFNFFMFFFDFFAFFNFFLCFFDFLELFHLLKVLLGIFHRCELAGHAIETLVLGLSLCRADLAGVVVNVHDRLGHGPDHHLQTCHFQGRGILDVPDDALGGGLGALLALGHANGINRIAGLVLGVPGLWSRLLDLVLLVAAIHTLRPLLGPVGPVTTGAD